jgi:hypothetical protein
VLPQFLPLFADRELFSAKIINQDRIKALRVLSSAKVHKGLNQRIVTSKGCKADLWWQRGQNLGVTDNDDA